MMTNPGEPAAVSRYDDPAVLAELGYNGLVVYETTALSGILGPDEVADPDLSHFVRSTLDRVSQTVDRVATQSPAMEVYLAYDLLVLGAEAVGRQAEAFCCQGRPEVLCPGKEAVYEKSLAALDAMLDRWPQVAGVVLRFGDTDAARLPHLTGNDIYTPHCPHCANITPDDRVLRVMTAVHERVVQARGKRLIARAWNVRPGGLHDDAALAAAVADRLPGDPEDDRFVLSFKVAATDFWRYQPWNASSLAMGRRPVLYELQCQREFEGKGALPNYQAGLWRNGQPEAVRLQAGHDATGQVSGLADAASRVNFAGVLSWVRGGGWGGPFVRDETWIDANVHAAAKLADDPQADPAALARAWVADTLPHALGPATDGLVQILQTSSEMIRKAFYIEAFARHRKKPWYPAADWIQDDLLDVAAAVRMIQSLPDDELDAVVNEKQEAVQRLAAMEQALLAVPATSTEGRSPKLQKLMNTLYYSMSLVETLRDLLAGIIACRRYRLAPTPELANQTRARLLSAQTHWNHHTQRFGQTSGAASPFREQHFWELTQEMLVEIETR